MTKDAPDTVPLAESTLWLDTKVGDVFAPHVRVQLAWADIEAAVNRGAIHPAEAHGLWADWADPGNPRRVHRRNVATHDAEPEAAAPQGARFTFGHVLYYFGGMLAIGAMSLFMTMGWSLFGPWISAVIALAYMVGALKTASYFRAKNLRIPAGIMATLAVCLVPLVVWSMQVGMGWWPKYGTDAFRDFHLQMNWRFIMIEAATLITAVMLLRAYRLPFMLMPIAVVLWYASMDAASFVMQNNGFDWKFFRDFSLVFGLATCAVAVWVDLRCRMATEAEDQQDFAFWLYVFGTIMFWTSLSFRDSDSEWSKAGYALLNVVLVFWGAAINRRVFTVFGALGVAIYLGYLSSRVFKDSLGFTFALTLVGLGVVALGVWWQRHEAQIHRQLARWLPTALSPLAQEFGK